MKIIVHSLSELSTVAEKIFSFAGDRKIFAFYGAMGSGKTTLIKALCKQMGVKDNTSSPTFAIVNEYSAEKAGIIYHFDFYRLKNEREALDIGCEEYFYSGNYCFIEWPEKIANLLPGNIVKVIIVGKNGAREITVKGH